MLFVNILETVTTSVYFQ
uniref:Uncharacterized protein n=1 Tax=Anguilla anguilla TaxID=7936 RepID=A0A0E9VFY8_ANGAN